jgi:hypothetical protein
MLIPRGGPSFPKVSSKSRIYTCCRPLVRKVRCSNILSQAVFVLDMKFEFLNLFVLIKIDNFGTRLTYWRGMWPSTSINLFKSYFSLFLAVEWLKCYIECYLLKIKVPTTKSGLFKIETLLWQFIWTSTRFFLLLLFTTCCWGSNWVEKEKKAVCTSIRHLFSSVVPDMFSLSLSTLWTCGCKIYVQNNFHSSSLGMYL